MGRMWGVVLAGALAWGCSGTTSGKGPGKSGPPALDPALRASGQALVDALTPALVTCHALIDPIDPAAAEANKLPFDAAGLTTACGAARDLYDAKVDALSGKSRQIDLVLHLTAALGDDVDYLGRALADTGAERKLAVTVLHDALAKATDGLSKWPAAKVYPYRCTYGGESGQKQWALDLANDARDGKSLRDHLDQFAFNQGLNPDQVRRRSLDTFLRSAVAYQPFRTAALAASDLTADDKASKGAYVAAYKSWIDEYGTVAKSYTSGAVKNEAMRTKLIADADASVAAWKAAWDVEKAKP